MNRAWHYKDSILHLDNYPLNKIPEGVRTPFYIYSTKTLLNNYNHFYQMAAQNGLTKPLVCFAVKSNANPNLLKVLAKNGCGADIVSGGELKRSLESGIPAEKIVFSGVGKQDWEIELALTCGEEGIYSFNVESIEELTDIEDVAKRLGKKARIAFRLNPQVNAKTHKHISTGFKTHKFGILKADIKSAVNKFKYSNHLNLVGLSIHIGSQLVCMEATAQAVREMSLLANEVEKLLGRPLEFLDVGGGLGIDYDPCESKNITSPDQYMKIIARELNQHLTEAQSPRIVFEPGRCISATCGLFVTKVLRTKFSENNKFIIVDGGMNDFVRSSLYEAYHHILPVKDSNTQNEIVDVVGPICETADCFASKRELPTLEKGELISVCDTGAYGFTMAGTYNLRPLPQEVVLFQDGSLIIS